MVFERPGPRYKYVLRPKMTIKQPDGTVKTQIGVYAWFTGYPPRFDSEKEAKRIADVERQFGEIPWGNDKAFDKKVQWWNEQIIKQVTQHKDFNSDPYSPQPILPIQ